MGGEVKNFVSVSSQFVAVFDALHYENFLDHITK